MYKLKNVLFAKQVETPQPKPSGTKSGNVSRPVKPSINLPRFLFPILALLVLVMFPITSNGAKLAMLVIGGDNKKWSGRASGNVYMRNGVVRSMAFFAKVLNEFTSTAKAIFSFFNSNWNALSDAQRKTWLAYETFVSNRFAQSVKVTGKTAYVRLNVNIANVNGTAITSAPSASSPAYTALVSLTADASAGTVSLAYVVNAVGDTTKVYATKPLNAGVYKPSNSAFRLLSIADTSAASPVAIGADYVARFGAITGAAGKKMFVRTVVTDALTGLESIADEVSTYIVA